MVIAHSFKELADHTRFIERMQRTRIRTLFHAQKHILRQVPQIVTHHDNGKTCFCAVCKAQRHKFVAQHQNEFKPLYKAANLLSTAAYQCQLEDQKGEMD